MGTNRIILRLLSYVAIASFLFSCSQLGKMKIDVSKQGNADEKKEAAVPVITAISNDAPKNGESITLKGMYFAGGSMNAVLVLSDNSQIAVVVTVVNAGEARFVLDGLPTEARIVQVLLLKNKDVVTEYTVPEVVAAPTFSVSSGAYTTAQMVEISATEKNAKIYYTLDGSEPSKKSALEYHSPIQVAQSLTIKAIVTSGPAFSAVAIASYTINGTVEPPIFSLASGLYSSDQTVSLTTATEGSRILYTLDGSNPSNSSAVYSAPLVISSNVTIKAVAVKPGYLSSAVVSADYSFKASQPVASVSEGFYTSKQYVSLSTATPGASIYYTVDGSAPSVSSTLYAGAISIVGNKTLKAIAVKAGYAVSTVMSKNYQVILQLIPDSPVDNDGANMVVTELTNGNLVVAKPYADVDGITNAGSVSLYHGITGQLISIISGSSANDSVGLGVTALTNGNFVIVSPMWDCQASLGCSGTVTDAGAVTWGSGVIGVSGKVTASNSLVGSTASDQVGKTTSTMIALTALTNGNYVVRSSSWDCQVSLGCSGTIANVGAVTWGDGFSGSIGPVSASNSLIGSTANDQVGGTAVAALSNGNYVVASHSWNCQVSLGCSGAVTAVGAVTWANGTTGLTGVVNTSNSLIGSSAYDLVGNGGVLALTNGNYVVTSYGWNCQTTRGCASNLSSVGAVTWGNGSSGIVGLVNTSNSLVGTTASDQVGGYSGAIALSNGNYVVSSPYWDCGVAVGCAGTITNAGAVTWGNGAAGITGVVSTSNSLIGSTDSDQVGYGGVTALSNGNYVVRSSLWDCQIALGCSSAVINVGAATWGNGTTGIVGVVSTGNSLVGATAEDRVSDYGVTALSNGNFVVRSRYWDCQTGLGCSGAVADVGAATWGNGSTGLTGVVSATNSLVGSTANDMIGISSVKALSNGNYLVVSQYWDCQVSLGCSQTAADVGAVTWGNGATGITGFVNSANSLIGSTANDQVGSNGVMALTNGHYVVLSSTWDCQASLGCSGSVTNSGAVTWGNGTVGITGYVSISNSLTGAKANDGLGSVGAALSNGNYVVGGTSWDSVANLNVGLAAIVDGNSASVGIIPRN